MRYSVNIPNFGDFADPAAVATVARAAEDAGWDALFLWDHVVHHKQRRRGQPIGDPWLLLAAAALATTRLQLGPLVTPVPRRRPQQLARQVSTLDAMSGGRVIFSAGLGGPIEDEYGSFGEPTDPVVLAELLDEGLELLDRYWRGERVSHTGKHFSVRDVELLPPPVQRPRPRVWIAAVWPHRRPVRRAARWDGVVPLFDSGTHGQLPPVDGLRELVEYCAEHRSDPAAPFEVVVGGRTDPAHGAEQLAEIAAAGATWWDERQLYDSPDLYSLTAVLRRIEAGPPAG